ncbi:MAG: hypothetical protein WKG01_13180 [Kofleriaceae bacterium]
MRWLLVPLCAVQLVGCVAADDGPDPDDGAEGAGAEGDATLPPDAPDDVPVIGAGFGAVYTFSGGDSRPRSRSSVLATR